MECKESIRKRIEGTFRANGYLNQSNAILHFNGFSRISIFMKANLAKGNGKNKSSLLLLRPVGCMQFS